MVIKYSKAVATCKKLSNKINNINFDFIEAGPAQVKNNFFFLVSLSLRYISMKFMFPEVVRNLYISYNSIIYYHPKFLKLFKYYSEVCSLCCWHIFFMAVHADVENVYQSFKFFCWQRLKGALAL